MWVYGIPKCVSKASIIGEHCSESSDTTQWTFATFKRVCPNLFKLIKYMNRQIEFFSNTSLFWLSLFDQNKKIIFYDSEGLKPRKLCYLFSPWICWSDNKNGWQNLTWNFFWRNVRNITNCCHFVTCFFWETNNTWKIICKVKT